MTPPGTLTLNGSPRPLAEAIPLATLLDQLGLAGKPVVVELNREALAPREHGDTMVHPGDHLEVVTLAAGG